MATMCPVWTPATSEVSGGTPSSYLQHLCSPEASTPPISSFYHMEVDETDVNMLDSGVFDRAASSESGMSAFASNLSPSSNSSGYSPHFVQVPAYMPSATQFGTQYVPSAASPFGIQPQQQLIDVDFQLDYDKLLNLPSPVSYNTIMPSNTSMGIKLEPMSPPTSETSSLHSQDIVSHVGRKIKSKEDKICGVCGDKALGFNFDAISCESCKAFFRRNAAKGVETFKCPYDGHCKMDISNRRFCKRCRLRKCLEIGMKKEYILSEEEKIEKRKKIDQNKVIRELERLGWLPKDLSVAELSERELLTEPQIEEISQIVNLFRQTSESVKIEERLGQQAKDINDLINFAELSMMRIIDLCKKLGPFKELNQPDKVCLLKGGAMELILLRGAISFDFEKGQFLDSNDSEVSDSMMRDVFLRAAGEDAGEACLSLFTSLRFNLQCDDATLIILLLCCLFSPDRLHLSQEGRKQVEDAQMHYCHLLDRLLRTRFSVKDARKYYPQLLIKLAELRALDKSFAHAAEINLHPEEIRPLMTEVLELHHEAAAKDQNSS